MQCLDDSRMEVYIPKEEFQELIYKGEVNICNTGGEVTTVHNGSREVFCWLCGSKNNVTKHHVLNKSWGPKRNIKIPICRDCHDQIHLTTPRKVIRYKRKKFVSGSKKESNLLISNNRLIRDINFIKKTRDKLQSKLTINEGLIKAKPFNGSNWVRFK